MILLYKQRDFGEKINATFQYAVQQFRSLGTCLLYIAGPIALMAGYASGIYQYNLLRLSPYSRVGLFSGVFSLTYLLSFLFTALTGLVVSLTVYGHLKVYRDTNGGPVAVGEVWTQVWSSLGQAMILSVLVALILVVGLFFLLIPGIYLGVVFSLAIVIAVFEAPPLNQVFGRCFELIREKWWSTLGLVMIMALITWVMSLLFIIPNAVVSLLNSMKVMSDVPVLITILTSIIGTIGRALLSSLISLAVAFQYFNLVERREGVGLLADIESIGTLPTATRTNDEGDF